MKKLKVVEVLQYNGVNMKVISTKRTTVKIGLLHNNTPVVWLPFWVHELLMSLKSQASGEVPQASKIWGLLAQWARWNSNVFRAQYLCSYTCIGLSLVNIVQTFVGVISQIILLYMRIWSVGMCWHEVKVFLLLARLGPDV